MRMANITLLCWHPTGLMPVGCLRTELDFGNPDGYDPTLSSETVEMRLENWLVGQAKNWHLADDSRFYLLVTLEGMARAWLKDVKVQHGPAVTVGWGR